MSLASNSFFDCERRVSACVQRGGAATLALAIKGCHVALLGCVKVVLPARCAAGLR